MSTRKELTRRIVLKDGSAFTIKIKDDLIVEDVLILGMKAEGYRVSTGRDVAPIVDRRQRDYLIKTGVL